LHGRWVEIVGTYVSSLIVRNFETKPSIAILPQAVNRLSCRSLTGGVIVEEQYHIVRNSVEQKYLMW
jgi:hypothetical protein